MTLRRCAAPLIVIVLTHSVAAAGAADVVLRLARGFEDGGGYNADWSGSGSPVAITFKGATILSAHDGGTYCSGFTFAVVMAAAKQSGLLESKTVAQVRQFQRDWYGVTEGEVIRERQCAKALVDVGIGTEVSTDRARPGDFVQFWRKNGTGHSAVFLGWLEEGGERVGIRYRSSQQATTGIGDHAERFSGASGVNVSRIYFGRLNE